ncbi:hypothetical protein ACFWUZ_20175 [Streptomyces sp. NPDC058646]|uniref:hypothetical protein n=1 Tax=Streptomyces sp. NPDC058646 TaxID=3346574 RepID=UPI00364AF671
MEPHTEATPLLPLACAPLPGLPLQPGAGRPPQPSGGPHSTSTAERGAFCLAVCTCGWSGPARRSRDLARKDATRHTAQE